ncbi:putative membrane protein YccC [Amorphus suaedae]
MTDRVQRAADATPLRYRHSRAFHAARTGVGVLVCIGLTTALHVPHGLWTTISFLVVITGLQHHGNIRRKALERVVGTLVGAGAGLLVLLQQEWLQQIELTWLLLALFCAACAYHAVGRAGYMALLAGLTLIIVTGQGTDPLDIGLWRALNVLIGVAVALALSFVQPLYATWFWRDVLANALLHCEEALSGAAEAVPTPAGEAAARRGLAGIGGTLQSLRTLMPSAAKESGVPMPKMEEIQRSVRIVVSSVELLTASEIGPSDVAAQCRMLHELAAALRAGALGAMPAFEAEAAAATAADRLSLVHVLDEELQRLPRLLEAAPGLWHG